MIVLNKKRIVLVMSSVLLSLFIFVLTSNKNEELEGYIDTVSLPVSGKTVVVDAGHGIPDERNSLLTLKNNIDLLQKIKCFKHFIFFMLKRRLIYAKQRIW